MVSPVCTLPVGINSPAIDRESQDVLKGTLDMLILKALETTPMHGWGIGERIAQLSRDVFRLQTGTLYPALHRLLRKGSITAEWRTTENRRQARYYRLTALGRKHLDSERESWSRASLAVNRILGAESCETETVMSWFAGVYQRLRELLQPSRVAAELDDELRESLRTRARATTACD